MKLFRWNIHISRRNEPAAARQKGFAPEAWLRGEEPAGASLSNAYQQVVWVYRAVNALAEQVANIPFLFSAGERGRENLITSGPLQDFYAQPHPQIDRFQYWELRVIWLMLRGECMRVPIFESSSSSSSSSFSSSQVQSSSSSFSSSSSPSFPLSSSAGPLPSSGGEGRGGEANSRSTLLRSYAPTPSRSHAPNATRHLRSVLILDPCRFQHILEDHQLIGWRYTGLGPQAPLASQVFLPEEVWFEKLPNPFDFWRGFPPLYAAAMAAQTDFAAGAFMRGLIENNADNGVIVRSKEAVGEEQQEQIVAALKQRKRRAGEADRPLFLNGVTEIVQPRLSSTDLQFLDNRKFSRAEICAAFGVPEEVVTTTEHAKYDVMAGARLNFIENRVAPLCRRLEAAEEATVRSIDPQAGGWFDLDSLPILQEARRNRLTAARTGFEMGVPFNELNRVLDLGFKPLAWGDRGYVGATLQQVGDGGTKFLEPRSVGMASSPSLIPSPFLSDGDRGDAVPTSCRLGPDAFGRDIVLDVRDPSSNVRGGAPTNRDREDPADAVTRAEALLGGLQPADRGCVVLDQPQGPSNLQRQVLSKLQRFNFEQRGRVLGKLTQQLDEPLAADETPAIRTPQAHDCSSLSPRERAGVGSAQRHCLHFAHRHGLQFSLGLSV